MSSQPDQSGTNLRHRMIEGIEPAQFFREDEQGLFVMSEPLRRFSAARRMVQRLTICGAFSSTIDKSGVQPPTINSSVAALRFFFNVTADRPELARYLSVAPRARKLPVVLSEEEVARLLDAAPGIKYKAALSVAYGAGLRVSEVRCLRVSDVNSKRMVLRIEQGKGRPGSLCDAVTARRHRRH